MAKKIHNERNAGRKPMYGVESAQSKTYTIPKSHLTDFDEYARKKIAEYKAQYPHQKKKP